MKLIDGDKLKEMLHTAAMPMTEYGRGVQTGYMYACAFIDNMPAIEAETVQHGHWVDWSMLGERKFECSECDFSTKRKWGFCPNCGAKMDGGAEDG